MPLVLITNGNRQGTWYKGHKNKACQISDYTDKYFRTTSCGDGTVLREDGALLFTEAEYNEILQQRDKMIDDLKRHAQTIVDMQNELNASREMVELPRDVAEAIEFLRQRKFSDFGIIALSDQIPMLDRVYSAKIIEHLKNIHSYPLMHKIVRALVNGYTIEQTPEERLQAKVEGMISSWYKSPYSDAGPDEDIHQLAAQIVEQAKQLT
ncbi:hypothetical protein D3C74_188880 [compost metagenome]